jgi:Raf kinase inhibitor-like YbhB/YbcL family protein
MTKNILMLMIMTLVSFEAFAGTLTLSSSNLESGKPIKTSQVFNRDGCKGGNISPQLLWSDAPSETKSFAVTMYDPDAPTGSGWWHWVVFNIPANVNKLDENAGNSKSGKLPAGAVQSQTDFGSAGYGGPCPPLGDKPHRYIVTVYALKKVLPLDAKSLPAWVGFHIQQNKIAEASIIATYQR